MHFIFVFLLSLLISFTFSNPSWADDFGERFYNEAPKGLGDFTAENEAFPDIAMDDMAEELQEIMPAAGEEQIENTHDHVIDAGSQNETDKTLD